LFVLRSPLPAELGPARQQTPHPGCFHPKLVRYPVVFLAVLPLISTALRAKPSSAKPAAHQVEASGTVEEPGQGFWCLLRRWS
jgi:hypothetical protein